eukprot:comp11302_c0_seq1/m.5707 comp11302_c0_seq1/g.5707  ORF comp11302_c0_seq1/g.5707 comp11302_c0_seq1/m.5707 type:complete len:419 (-) comp11302_c0_seq1:33-1289(-)
MLHLFSKTGVGGLAFQAVAVLIAVLCLIHILSPTTTTNITKEETIVQTKPEFITVTQKVLETVNNFRTVTQHMTETATITASVTSATKEQTPESNIKAQGADGAKTEHLARQVKAKTLGDAKARRAYCEALYPIPENELKISEQPADHIHPQFLIATHGLLPDTVSWFVHATFKWEMDVSNAIFNRLLNDTYMDGKIFLDIGANVGWYTMIALAKGYNVVAFEPMPQNARLVRLSACLNGWEDRLLLYPFGVSTEERTCEVISDPENMGNGNTVCSEEEKAAVAAQRGLTGKFVVQSKSHYVKLDDYLPPDVPVGFMKIDIEGYEKIGLSNAGAEKLFADKKRRPPYIASEVIHCKLMAPHDCEGSREYIELMQKRDYDMLFYPNFDKMKDWGHLRAQSPADIMWVSKEYTEYAQSRQ